MPNKKFVKPWKKNSKEYKQYIFCRTCKLIVVKPFSIINYGHKFVVPRKNIMDFKKGDIICNVKMIEYLVKSNYHDECAIAIKT